MCGRLYLKLYQRTSCNIEVEVARAKYLYDLALTPDLMRKYMYRLMRTMTKVLDSNGDNDHREA